MIFFKSRLYREEILRWSLIVVLFLWALTASLWALSKSSEMILISMKEEGVRLITDKDDKALHDEPIQFVKNFIDCYLTFDENTHAAQIGKAADLMSVALWESSKAKLYEVNQKMKHNPLRQTSEIQSIDLTASGKYEILVSLRIVNRMNEVKALLKVSLSLQKRERTKENPWAYEVTELSYETP